MIRFSSQTINSFIDCINNTKKTTIFTHTNPDGDAIGSALGLVTIFKQLQIEAKVIIPNNVPKNLRWLPNFDTVLEGLPKATVEDIVNESDTIICVDFNQAERIEKYAPILYHNDKTIILIDHHTAPQINAYISLTTTETSSTCELIHHIVKNVPGIQPTTDYATCIYTGIVTDTGMFKHSSNQIDTFETVIELIKLGINKDEITQNIYNTQTENSIRMLGLVLHERMVVKQDIHTAYIYLTIADQKKYNYQPGDSENFVNYPLTIKDIYFSAFFQERENDIKISFRSEGKFEVNKFAAQHFNGGGHKNASGGKSVKTLDTTIEEFEQLAKSYAQQIKK